MTKTTASRSFPVLFVVLAGIGFWGLVLVAGLRASPLTDPAEILTHGAQATAKADSFHFAVSMTGTVTDPQVGMPVPLDDLTLAGDVDVANEAVHLTFGLPSLMGMAGEVIVIGQDAYLKTSITGDKWVHSTTPEGEQPVSERPTDDEIADRVDELLATEGVVVEKLEDAPCGEDTCYHVQLTVPAEAMTGGNDPMGDLGGMDFLGMSPEQLFGGEAVVDLLFDQRDLWLRQVSTSAASPEAGEISFAVEFSNYDESLDITAPPPDQVIEESEVQFPF